MAKEDTKVADDDVEIEIIEGPNELDDGKDAKPTTEAKADTVVAATDPSAGVDALKRQLDTSNAARVAAENARRASDARAQQAGQIVDQTRAQALEAYEVSAKQAKVSGEASLKAAKASYVAAMEAANFAEAANAQADIASATNTISGANYQLGQLETIKKQMTDAATMASQPQRRPTVSTDVVVESGSRSAQWIARHPEFNDPTSTFKNKAMSAHYNALAEGIPVESDDYFAYLDKAVNQTLAAEAVTTKVAPKTTTATAAPASRSVATSEVRNEKPELVRLTRAQMEAAEISGMKPKDYARHLLALQADGKIGRMN